MPEYFPYPDYSAATPAASDMASDLPRIDSPPGPELGQLPVSESGALGSSACDITAPPDRGRAEPIAQEKLPAESPANVPLTEVMIEPQPEAEAVEPHVKGDPAAADTSATNDPVADAPVEDRTGYKPWQTYRGTLPERVGDKISPSIAVPLGSLSISDEVNGVPYEDLPLTTADELGSIAARKEAEMQEAREASGEVTKPPNSSSVEGMISETRGPFLEIGGPSQKITGGTSIDLDTIDKPLIVSNVYPQFVQAAHWRSLIGEDTINTERPGPTYRKLGVEEVQDPITWERVRRMPDAKIDGENLPEGNGYLGSIYARALHPDVELPLVEQEAPRALEPGGIIVMDRVKDAALKAFQRSPYFDILKQRRHGLDPTRRWTSVAARRNDTPYPTGR